MTLQATTQPPLSYAALPIIAGNAVPLAGVLLWDWDVFELMFLYWAENIIIGLITVLGMIITGAHNGPKGLAAGIGLSLFFTLHYGLFCMGHGAFVLSLFYQGTYGPFHPSGLFAPIDFLMETQLWRGFAWALAGIAVVQAVRFAMNWTAIRDLEPKDLMTAPYTRIVILHVTLIFSGMLIMALNQPIAALLLLVVLKTAFDLGLFKLGHKKKESHDHPA